MGWQKAIKKLKYLLLILLLLEIIETSSDDTSSNVTSTVSVSREGSSKVSSEKNKGHNDSNLTSLPLPRRNSNGRVRELMTVRRSMPNRWRSTVDMKITRNGVKNQKASESSGMTEMSTTNLNLVIQNVDEFLETDESIHGFSFANPNNGTFEMKETKESSNQLISKFDSEKSNISDSKLEIKDKLNSETPISAKNRRNKYSRTSIPPIVRTSTVKVNRGRIKFSPSNVRTFEEVYAEPYLIIGQTTARIPEARRHLGGRKMPTYQITTPSRSKEEELEIMEVSVAKQSSTEKNKFWKTRNIVAINNYMRRFSPKSPEKFDNITKLAISTVRYETIHTPLEEGQTSASISAVNNLSEGAEKNKNMFSRSTFVNNSEEYIPRHLPSLIINVPDDARPIFNDPINSDVTSTEITTSQMTTSESTESNKMSENTATQSTLAAAVVPSTEFPRFPLKPTKRVYTTIPRRKPTPTIPSTFSNYNQTTISTFLSNISSKRNKIMTTTDFISPSTTIIEPSTTVPYQANIDFEKTSAAIDVEIVAPSPSSITPEPSTLSSPRTQILFAEILTTMKPTNNDVLVEMQKVNVAAFIMAGLGLLPLIVIIIYVLKVKFDRNKRKDNGLETYGNDISPVVTLHSDDDSGSIADRSIISELNFNRGDLRFKSLLGEGNFGQVWKAEVDNLHEAGTTRIVAVKTERAKTGGLKNECDIMRKLKTHCENVVVLLGACIEQEPHLLILEYAMRGKLLSLLRAARGILSGIQQSPRQPAPVMPLSPQRLVRFANDIAKGMEYISDKKIVHRDLAARNVLIDHNGICKICDFGMSIDLEKTEKQMKIPRVSCQNKFKFDMTARVFGLKNAATSKSSKNNCEMNKNRPALPVRWMAPEALKYNIYSVETDVFAFGIVLWEISTLGITPFPTLSGREVITGIQNGIRPEIDPIFNSTLSETMKKCWQHDPSQRPSFTEVRKILSRTLINWQEDIITTNASEFIDVSGFSEDYENGMIYFNRRVSEFECEI